MPYTEAGGGWSAKSSPTPCGCASHDPLITVQITRRRKGGRMADQRLPGAAASLDSPHPTYHQSHQPVLRCAALRNVVHPLPFSAHHFPWYWARFLLPLP